MKKYYRIRIDDFSRPRSEVKSKAQSLSEKFMVHFAKCVVFENDWALNHWKGEMFGWLEDCYKMTIKPNSRHMGKDEWIDWFFFFNIDCKSDYELCINHAYGEEDRYEDLEYSKSNIFIMKYKQFVTDLMPYLIVDGTTSDFIKDYVYLFDFSEY